MIYFLEEVSSNLDSVICGGADVLRAIRFIFLLIKVICLVVPSLLILLISINFIKGIIANSIDDMKKETNLVIKKIVMCVIFFLVPTVVLGVNSILGEFGFPYSECVDIAKGNEDLSQYEVVYPENNSNNGSQADDFSNTRTIVSGSGSDNSSGSGSSSGSSSSGSSSSEVDTGSNIYIGDSRFVGMKSAVSGDKGSWICLESMGYSWFSTTAVSELANVVKSDKSYNIFINMGVNDLGDALSYSRKYKELVDLYKNSKIIIVSVNPVDDDRSQFAKNAAIQNFNNEIKKVSGIKYCDTYTKLVSSGYDTVDGIHYTSSTYQNIYNMMLDCAK